MRVVDEPTETHQTVWSEHHNTCSDSAGNKTIQVLCACCMCLMNCNLWKVLLAKSMYSRSALCATHLPVFPRKLRDRPRCARICPKESRLSAPSLDTVLLMKLISSSKSTTLPIT